MRKSVCFEGVQLHEEVTINSGNPQFVLNGAIRGEQERAQIPIDDHLLSKHVLMLGGIGTGKSNLFYHFIRSLRYGMTDQDVMIIFDAKGDYYQQFYREGDIIISNDDHGNVGWNLFEEIMVDDRHEENAMEVTRFLFSEKIKKTSQPFFPNAARDLFTALILHMIRNKNSQIPKDNATLRAMINTFDVQAMKRILSRNTDLKGMISYIANEDSGQTMGVVSELQQTIREILIGKFKQHGNFSIRKQIRKKGKKVIFIEFDLGIGKTLSPIYSLIIDLAIKEALCRSEASGNIYFVLDEFRLLSPLEHMDNGVNFGRSLGAKFLVGVQNVEQVYDVYGEKAGMSILSGLSTLFAFRLNDAVSREFVKARAGKSLKMMTYMSKVQTKGIVESIRDASVIEDWDIVGLKTGEMIVQSLESEPFRFKVNQYK